MYKNIKKIYNFLLLTGGLFAIALNKRAIRSGYDLNLSTFRRKNIIIFALVFLDQFHLVHEFLAVLYHKLDRGVLELLGVVKIGQDQALQAGVHGQVVTQRLLARNQCHNVRFKYFDRDLPRIFLSILTIGTCLPLLRAVETLC